MAAIELISPGNKDRVGKRRLFAAKCATYLSRGIGLILVDVVTSRAANLHETHLNREQLVEVIACGRPGTEMPHFDKYAYEDTDCYGLKGKNLGNDAARDPHSTSLTKREIEAVVDYILAKFVGK